MATVTGDSNSAIPAMTGDNTATTGGPFGHHPKQETAGVFGHSKRGHGVVGTTDDGAVFAGVLGIGTGVGVTGQSPGNGTGVQGFADGENGMGVFGQGGRAGVVGNTISAQNPGVLGINGGNGPGILGTSIHEAGVRGTSQQGTGVVGIGGTFAAEFVGKVRVQGDIAVSGDVILTTAHTAGALATEHPDNKAAAVPATPAEQGGEKAVTEISLAQKLADIDARTQRLETMLNGLIRATARVPDGRTLINVVGTIENKVNQL